MAPRTSHDRLETTVSDVRRRWLRWCATGCALTLVVAATVMAAPPNRPAPGQRIDVRVLLLSADGTEPGFGAWKAELAREGVPYDTFVAYNGQARGGPPAPRRAPG